MASSSRLPPGLSVDPTAIAFFDQFYQTSDTPTAHEQYAGMFAPDATFIMASKTSVGTDQILATRQGMWTAVASREHTVYKIFPFGSDSQQFMLYGLVKYTLKTGAKTQKEWAGRADLVKGADGQWKFKFYQVYLDAA